MPDLYPIIEAIRDEIKWYENFPDKKVWKPLRTSLYHESMRLAELKDKVRTVLKLLFAWCAINSVLFLAVLFALMQQ